MNQFDEWLEKYHQTHRSLEIDIDQMKCAWNGALDAVGKHPEIRTYDTETIVRQLWQEELT